MDFNTSSYNPKHRLLSSAEDEKSREASPFLWHLVTYTVTDHHHLLTVSMVNNRGMCERCVSGWYSHTAKHLKNTRKCSYKFSLLQFIVWLLLMRGLHSFVTHAIFLSSQQAYKLLVDFHYPKPSVYSWNFSMKLRIVFLSKVHKHYWLTPNRTQTIDWRNNFFLSFFCVCSQFFQFFKF